MLIDLLKKLASRFTASASPGDQGAYLFTVQCQRCGEILHGRVDLNDELSVDYGEDASATTYLCRKVLLGKRRCYQPIEVRLTFDARRRLLERHISGGQFVDE